MREDTSGAIARELRTQFIVMGSFLITLWVVELIDLLVFQGRLDFYGIRPRNPGGLWGILWAPFLHANLGHLIANTIPLLTLGWFVMLRDIGDFLVVTAIALLVGGFGTWFFGAPNTVHVGASGLVFGYFGYLISRGYFERNLWSALSSLVICLLYGGLLWGILPLQQGISWEGHLFGFLGGILAARLLSE